MEAVGLISEFDFFVDVLKSFFLGRLIDVAFITSQQIV